MYFLMKTPAALSRLRDELRVALDGSQEIAKYATVKNLPYLYACINESLRLLPPVAFGLNRMTPPEGLMIDGTWIPGNTLVGVPAYTAIEVLYSRTASNISRKDGWKMASRRHRGHLSLLVRGPEVVSAETLATLSKRCFWRLLFSAMISVWWILRGIWITRKHSIFGLGHCH